MTKCVSKKVGIIVLCFSTILVSAFIGRNLYQGTPTFQNVASDKPRVEENAENARGVATGRRRIQTERSKLNIRKAGVLANKFDLPWELDDDELDDEDESFQSDAGPGRPLKRVVNVAKGGIGKIMRPEGGGRGITPSNDTKYIGYPTDMGWSIVGDPRLPRLVRKVLGKLPMAVRHDISPSFREFNMKRTRDKKLMYKQWQAIVTAFGNNGMEQRLPDCISIGVKKSGTNAIGFFVTQHPQIAHSLGNEVHFFDHNYEKGLEYYRVRMGFAKPDQISFEKTPKYFVTEDAPMHILKDLSKDIKFLISVRNPVDRALSDFRHESELKLRREKKTRLRDRNLKDRTPEGEGKIFEEMVLDKYGNVNASNVIIDTSNYAKHFKRWLKFFPRDRFMIVDLEILEKGAFSKLKELERFLGLKDYFQENMFYYDKERHGTCMHGRTRPCPAKSTPGVLPKAKISDATMKKLRDFYRPSNKEFMQLTGQDFPWAHL